LEAGPGSWQGSIDEGQGKEKKKRENTDEDLFGAFFYLRI
jgi:hypothetical protein